MQRPKNAVIATNVTTFKHELQSTLSSLNRQETSVRLVAVSKTRTCEDIRLAYAEGIRHFAENYCQEAVNKIKVLSDLDITWHFIGALQSNKIKLIANCVDWVQSVSSIKNASRLSYCRDPSLPPLNVLLQINISAEPQKAGASWQALHTIAAHIQNTPRLRLRGLMGIGHADDETNNRLAFMRLADNYRSLQQSHPDIDTLSLGMSNDWRLALEHQANLLRIGQRLFGPRTTPHIS